MPETPVTRRYPLFTSVVVVENLDSTNLDASVEVTSGEGVIVMIDVISQAVDEAR